LKTYINQATSQKQQRIFPYSLLGGIEFAKWIDIEEWLIDYAAKYAQEDRNLNQGAVGMSHNKVGRNKQA